MPELYNVHLETPTRNNANYINLIKSIYMISDTEIPKIEMSINQNNDTIIACLPYDIARTLTSVFIDNCKKRGYSAKVHFIPSGKNIN